MPEARVGHLGHVQEEISGQSCGTECSVLRVSWTGVQPINGYGYFVKEGGWIHGRLVMEGKLFDAQKQRQHTIFLQLQQIKFQKQ